MDTIFFTLLLFWQMPQCLVAWVLMLFYRKDHSYTYKGVRYYFSKNMSGGISLGNWVILNDRYYGNDPYNTINHEYGHCRQSRMLGPLYLLVIGLPSLIWAATYYGDSYGYFTRFYTERWADKLGGVERHKIV